MADLNYITLKPPKQSREPRKIVNFMRFTVEMVGGWVRLLIFFQTNDHKLFPQNVEPIAEMVNPPIFYPTIDSVCNPD